MIKELRKQDINIPVILTGTCIKPDLLLGIMKLGITDYLDKPFSLPSLFIRIEHIFEEIHYQHLALREKEELTQYLELLNNVAIVSKTDLKGKILFVNDIFCEVSGYSKEELIGEPHNIIRHPDMAKDVYKNLWETILSGNIWKGKVKNKTKNDDAYYVNATILPIYDDNEEIIGFIGIRFLITEDEDNKREFRKKVIDLIKTSKEKEIKLLNEIKKLREENRNHSNLLLALEDEKKKTIKQHSQIVQYEEEFKIMRNSLEELKSKFSKQIGKFTNEAKKLQTTNRFISKNNEENSKEIKAKNNEIKKLQEYIDEKNKIILNLKDVIEFGIKK